MIQKLFHELSQLPQVEAIALGGSRAGEYYDEKSDYDVYLYCTAPVPEQGRRDILTQYCSYLELGNQFWEYEDNCILNNGMGIDILYRNLDDFVRDLQWVVEQHQPRNGYTTCMWHNLLTCKILFDASGRLTAAKQRFSIPYPLELQQAIIRRNWQLLDSSMPAYRLQIQKALSRGDLISISHRTAAFMESYFDILFAINSLSHPGEKRLIPLAKQSCRILPADFEKDLQHLFHVLYTDSVDAQRTLASILTHLHSCLFENGFSDLL